jgi:AraC family transcriptional regulator, regulatory protein of adaptative response / methylphosphotriester-DNA alkyltransferase methyltransferase
VTLAVDADAIRDEARPRTRPATRQLRRAIFDDAVEILATEYSRPITIEEIARRVATSPRQLQRVFDEVGGLGFRAYLRRIRLSHAAALLAETDLTVTEVARRVGYSVSQFSKAFRRAYGVSPSRAPRLQAARLDRRDPALRRGVERSSKPGSPTHELIKPIGRADIAARLAESNDQRIDELERQLTERERFSRSLDAARNRTSKADVPPRGEKDK